MVNIFQQIEEREKKPMVEVLRERYEQYGSQKEVAKSLGVSQPTISLWLVRVGLKEKSIVVPKQEATRAQATA